MNKSLRLLGSFGLFSFLMMGIVAPNSQAEDSCLPKSPVRGIWSFSQSNQTFYSPLSLFIPSTEVGILTTDACGHSIGHGTLNDPGGSSDFDFAGDCVLREDGARMDCTLQSGGETNNVVCSLMEKAGECFQEYRCVASRPYDATQPGPVLLADLKRVHHGGCQ